MSKDKIEKNISKAVKIVDGVDVEKALTTGITETQIYAFIRQILIALGSGLVANGTFTDDQLQQIVGGIIAVGAVIYGQWRTRNNAAKTTLLADEVQKRG